VFGYSCLIMGFFYLNNNALFNTYAYLLGLFIVPLSALLLSVFSNKKEE